MTHPQQAKRAFPCYLPGLGPVLIAAVLLRICLLEFYGFGSVRFADGPDYLKTAAFICVQGMYPEFADVPFFRPPMYPAVLALLSGCGPQWIAALKLLNVAADGLSIAAVFLVCRRCFSDQVARLAACGMAISPALIFQTMDIRSEPFFTALLISGLALFIFSITGREVQQQALGSLRIAMSGLVLTLAALTRPASLTLFPFLAILLLRSPKKLAFFTLAVCLTLAPWAARNYARFGELILVNDGAGYNLWRGSHPAASRSWLSRQYAGRDNIPTSLTERKNAFQEQARNFEFNYSAPAARKIQAENASPAQRSRAWSMLAVENIRDSYSRYVKRLLENAADFWRPSLNPLARGALPVLLSTLWFLPLYMLSLAGLVMLFRERRGLAVAVIGYALVVTLSHLPFQAVLRFRIPFLEPVMIVLAAVAVVGIAGGGLDYCSRK